MAPLTEVQIAALAESLASAPVGAWYDIYRPIALLIGVTEYELRPEFVRVGNHVVRNRCVEKKKHKTTRIYLTCAQEARLYRNVLPP